jgi:hypothetical protein
LYAADGTGKCGSHLTTLYKDPASKNPQFPVRACLPHPDLRRTRPSGPPTSHVARATWHAVLCAVH